MIYKFSSKFQFKGVGHQFIWIKCTKYSYFNIYIDLIYIEKTSNDIISQLCNGWHNDNIKNGH